MSNARFLILLVVLGLSTVVTARSLDPPTHAEEIDSNAAGARKLQYVGEVIEVAGFLGGMAASTTFLGGVAAASMPCFSSRSAGSMHE